MNFFKKIQNSIYSPEFYSQIPKQSFGETFKYFLLLVLLASVIQSIMPIWLFMTVGQKEINTFVNKTVDSYPANLALKIKNGKLTTNVKEPYFIVFSADLNQTDEVRNLAVIDTKTPFSITQFNKYQTLSWITSDSIMIKDKDKGQLRAIDLTSVKDFTLNRQAVNGFVSKATPWLKLLLPIVVMGILIGLFLLNMFLLVYLLFVSIVIWLILKVIQKPLTYVQSYKVGMHAITLALLLGIVIDLLHQPDFPFMSIILTLLVVLFNLYSQPNKVALQKKSK